ncbi:MAG: sigma-70 family RNA polymerase sigma factor [Lentisphaeraceae bacterium]|nr:sigma-70 family RNA polymerase sigma factor [Lentisphaeraceae bacterium]
MFYRQILKRIKQGDMEAFRHVMKRYSPEVRMYLQMRIRDSHIVDDLTQEVFVAAYRNLAQVADEKKLGAWIQGIAKNKFRLWLRTQKTAKEAVISDSLPLVEWLDKNLEVVEEPQAMLNELYLCIEKLPEKLAQIIQRRYFEGRAVQEIAHKDESSVSAISSHLYRSRKLLKDCISSGDENDS